MYTTYVYTSKYSTGVQWECVLTGTYVSMCCVITLCACVFCAVRTHPSTHISSSFFLAFLFLRATVGCLPSTLSPSTLFLWATEKSSSSSLAGRHPLSCVSSDSSAGLRPSEAAHCLTWSSFFCTHSTKQGLHHMKSHDVTWCHIISKHLITYGDWLHTCFTPKLQY